MLAFSYYLLKVILASSILYGYYWLALRNKVFHQWNRFYLLATLILSFLLPLIKINIWREAQAANSGVIQLLQVVTTGDEFVEHAGMTSNSAPGADLVSWLIYVFVGISVMIGILISLLKILRLFRANPRQILGDIHFVNTEAEGTPFSFFRCIFWNNKIDIHSSTGQHIFKHELAHVREKHSIDKMLVNGLLIAFWANPIFWLIRRELGLVHEFIADQKSVEQNDTRAFAAMILQSAYPQHQLPLTNAFFYSPLKRRLLMLTKIQNPKIGYVSRIMVLPLAALVFAAFALKPKTASFNAPVGAVERTITVMIDPGHGGTDDGALAPDGTKEKDINLSIAKKIQKLNPYKNIIIMLSRDDDKYISVRDRVDLAKKSNIDAFISIHTNIGTDDSKPSGIELYVSRQSQTYAAYTRLLGSLIVGELSQKYKTDQVLKKNESHGVWVLDAPDLNYASLLIECGNMSFPEDLKYVTTAKNQDAIAMSILKSISNFASSPVPKPEGTSAMADTSAPKKLPKGVKSMEYTIDGNVIVMYNNGKAEKLTLKQAVQKGYITRSNAEGKDNLKNALIIIDGKEMPAGYDLNKLEPADITEISVLNDWEAAAKYGAKGKNGVVVIKTKSGKPGSGMIVKPDLAENYKIVPDGKTAGGQTYDKPRPDTLQVKP